MNTNGLAKLYDKLTVHERVSALLAAAERGDEVEKQRLARSAPRVRWEMPDYFFAGEAVRTLVLVYLLDMMEQVSLFWASAAVRGCARSTKQLDLLEQFRRLLAFRLCQQQRGWELFCDSLTISGDFLLSRFREHLALKRALECARKVAFTAEEAAAFAASQGLEERLSSAEEIAADLREGMRRIAADYVE